MALVAPLEGRRAEPQPRRLFLARVAADFDPARDDVAGPWCFVGAEDVDPQWEQLAFADPFPSADAWVEADLLTRRLANRLAADWAERLNARHRRAYSAGYWRTYIIMWLVSASQAAWSRYRYVEEAVSRHRGEAVTVEVFDAADWQLAGLHEFMHHLMFDDAFGLWLSSLAVRALAPPQWTLVPTAAEPLSVPSDQAKPPPRAGSLAALVRRLTGRLSFNSVYGVRGAKLPFSAYLSVLPKRRDAQVYFRLDDDAVLDAFPQPFLDMLDRLLEAAMPASYGPHFPELEAYAKQFRYVPGRVFIDSLGAQTDETRIVLAHAFEAGEKLVCSQHGSGYGTARTLPRASETDYRYHALLTWGWDTQDGFEGRFLPLPSPMLERLRDRHQFGNDTLVLVGSGLNPRGFRFHWGPRPHQWLRYRVMKREFIDALGAGPRHGLRYRPYVAALTSLRDAEYVAETAPDVPVLAEALHPALFNCRLAVLDHPGTTLSVAMAANVPLVLYWDPDAWPMCDSAEPYFAALRQAGLLFDDAEAAAAQLNRVWEDVPGWWRRPEVQAARLAWRDRFARPGRWWWQWAKALRRL